MKKSPRLLRVKGEAWLDASVHDAHAVVWKIERQGERFQHRPIVVFQFKKNLLMRRSKAGAPLPRFSRRVGQEHSVLMVS